MLSRLSFSVTGSVSVRRGYGYRPSRWPDRPGRPTQPSASSGTRVRVTGSLVAASGVAGTVTSTPTGPTSAPQWRTLGSFGPSTSSTRDTPAALSTTGSLLTP